MKQFPIAPDGWPHIIIGAAISVGLYFIFPWLALFGIVLTVFFCFFFRNPRRQGPEQADQLLSPADGKVMAVTELDHVDDLAGPAVKITIFLSLFNVHINRAPMSGEVVCRRYRPGKYLPAFKSHASELNESNTICISRGSRSIVISQITGFVARRIVCDVNPGDQLEQGERFGMIRFGSCTELLVPADAAVLAKVGDKVKGGRTVLARFEK